MTKAKVKLPKEPTRKQQSRAEREAFQQRWLLTGVVVVLVLTVGLLAMGVFNDRVLAPRQPVAKVGRTVITTEAFQKRVRYQYVRNLADLERLSQERLQYASDPQLKFILDQIDQQANQLQSQLSNAELTGKRVLDTMIEEELIRQEATRRNITIPPAEVSQAIEQNFGFYRVPPTPAPTSTPLPTPSVPVTVTPEPTLTPLPSPTPISEADYTAAYKNYLSQLATQSGMTESDLRALVETEMLRRKVQEAFTADVKPDVEQLKLRYLRFESEPAVQAATRLLAGGNLFSDLYAQVQSGRVVSTTNGETDWLLVDEIGQQFDKPVADQLLSLTISQTTGVITNVFGSSYAFQLTARETRTLDASQKQSKGQSSFEEWLTTQRQSDQVNYMQERYLEVVPAYKPQG